MSHAFLPGKLLICMVGRRKGSKIVDAARAAGARGATSVLGRAVLDNKILQMLSLADTQQESVFILMRDEAPAVLKAVTEACRENSKKFAGVAVLLDVSGMLARLHTPAPETTPPTEGLRSDTMSSGYSLLTVIVNNGYADDVMEKARGAGARGGTIIVGRGTASPEDVKFFGITLVPEKELLLIVTEKGTEEKILAAIRTVPTLAKPGGGIAYTMDVEQFVLLGQ